MSSDGLNLIAGRRSQIESELSLLRQREQALQGELAELDQAERVLTRLAGRSEEAIGATVLPEDSQAQSGKPEGTPPVSAMIRIALKEARERGRQGLEPKGIGEFISANWWPNVRPVDIGPIVWRMWRRGLLRKEGSIYMLPENETADA